MQEFITTSAAVEYTGKSQTTIKRLIQRTKKDASKERHLKEEKRGKQKFWTIEVTYLDESFGIKAPEPEGVGEEKLHAAEAAKDSVTQKLIDMLQAELDQKNEQLTAKDEHIKQLLDRNREANVLMKGYQGQLGIAAPGDEVAPVKAKQTQKGIWAFMTKSRNPLG